MKKIYLFLLMFSIFAIPTITSQAALTPPASYDYSFVYDSTDGEFQFKDGTNSYTPEFTRTADGIYFNYKYIGDAEGLLPFEVTLEFRRSNTSWTLGTTGYIATDTKIGSDATVGAIARKTLISAIISSNNDYLLYYDLSSTAGARGFNYKINNYSVITSTSSRVILDHAIMNVLYVNSKTSLFLESYIISATVYFNAFYLQDLGQSAAYTAGVESTTAYQEGYETGFGFGYQAGVEEDNAYALGYARGLSEGADMETGSSILIFVVAAIGFIMMIFGFTTRRGIFNLLSVGAFVVLGAMLAQYIGFIIIAIGLVIINVYYTFWGEI